jgi:predicted nucleic acid-binding protein
VKLYLDANVIIDAHEAADPLRQRVLNRLVAWCQTSSGELVTSLLSRLECRVIPLRQKDLALLAEYDRFFQGDAVEVVEITPSIIDLATSLRADHGYKSPDAIHLATAIQVGAQIFLTGDQALKKCLGIQVEVMS